MLRHSTIFRVYLRNLVSPGNCICPRNFARKANVKVKPRNVMIPPKNKPEENGPWGNADFSDIDPETREEFQNPDQHFEPNIEGFESAYYQYEQEKQNLHLKVKRTSVIRRHFKDEEARKKEISLLTWAEKENIHYLHKSDSQTWTPEAIAAAFPITITGAEKLIKSKFTLSTPKDIMSHDDHLKRRIEKIRAGEIELTPELVEKMEIREKIPFDIGGLPVSTKQLALYTETDAKPLGAFARIVASSKKIREADERLEEALQYAGRSEQIDTKFDEEMARLSVKRNDKLTLAEFEEKLKSAPSSPSGGPSLKEFMPEVGYLLNLPKRNKLEPTNSSEIVLEEASSSATSKANKFNRVRITKFKSQEEKEEKSSTSQEERVIMEKGDAYLYNHETGYQKPYSTPIKYKIEIPKHKRIPDSTYRVGDCYYDENGDFLYRVV